MLTVVTPADSYDLTRLDTVRAELGISIGSEDDNLARWITQASNAVAKHCNRVFALETVAETFRFGWRHREFQSDDGITLARFPVASIVSVIENDVTLDATDYELDAERGIIARLWNDRPARWCTGKIVITYMAGFSLPDGLPSGIERAAIMLINQYRYAAERDPQLRSEMTDGAGSSAYFDGLDAGGLSPEVRGLLAEYRKPAGA